MTEFVGYQGAEAEAKISAIIVDGVPTDRVHAGQEASIIVNKTPFYAESGGQAGDQGIMKPENSASMAVSVFRWTWFDSSEKQYVPTKTFEKDMKKTCLLPCM